ncbi:hypothetical protein DY000_02039448 [Brassica cretica]|uniref:Uncharacterized protein n=1 Tax=Brassica cretica TaxID=69181 RepID=A0ABQ7BDX8_BRACR|nr:hypothetical protein DY000_02039448 [Brassica cretica]
MEYCFGGCGIGEARHGRVGPPFFRHDKSLGLEAGSRRQDLDPPEAETRNLEAGTWMREPGSRKLE